MTTNINSVSANIDKDVWYHVAFTYSNNDVKLYLNNQLVGSNTTYQANIPLSSEDYYIGNDSTSYMDGTIDDMKFYNRVITSTELSYLANSNNNTSFLQNDLVGKYEFNEFDKTPTDLMDGSSLANNATPVNQPTYATGFVKGSKAIEFDSSSSQYLDISGVSYNNLDVSNFTVASWVNVNDISGVQPIVSKEGVFDFALSNGEIQLKIHNGTELIALDNFVRTIKTIDTHDNLIFNMNCDGSVNNLASGIVNHDNATVVENITFDAVSYASNASQSANFNGSDSFVGFSNGLQDTDLNEMTISGWIKPINDLSTGTYDIMSKSNVFNFGIVNNGNTSNALYFELIND